MKRLEDYEYFRTDYGILYLGNCFEILPLLPDKSIDLIVTDPPYNIGIDYGVYKDNLSEEQYKNFINTFLKEFNRVAKTYVIFPGGVNLYYYPKPTLLLIWLKRNNYQRWGRVIKTLYEPILCYNPRYNIFFDVYDFPIVLQKQYINHPTPKPPALIEKLVKDFSRDGEIVLDAFLGSGTTAIACEKLRRKWIGIEISKEYCDIAVERLKKWKGQERLCF